LIIITCSIGVAKATIFKDGVYATSCSSAIILDDLINGNVTADGKNFWIGLVKLFDELGSLNANVGDIQNNISTLASSNPTMIGYLNDISTAKNNIQLIPNNAATNVSANI
jgi:hypothetical protein